MLQERKDTLPASTEGLSFPLQNTDLALPFLHNGWPSEKVQELTCF